MEEEGGGGGEGREIQGKEQDREEGKKCFVELVCHT